MSVLNIQRNFNGDPNFVTMLVTDSLGDITTTGYLLDDDIVADIQRIQNGAFTWFETDLVTIYYSTGIGFFTMNPSTNSFVALAEPDGLSPTLSSANIFVGNSSNVATGVALTGDMNLDNAGLLTIKNGVVNNGKMAANAIATANIQDSAITNAKIAASSIGTSKIQSAAVNSSVVSPSLIQYAAVNLSAAQVIGMYATPVSILAASGTGFIHVVENYCVVINYNSIAFAGGGAIGLQYGNTNHLGGEPASITIPASSIQQTHSTIDVKAGATSADIANCVNLGVYLSNSTAAFTTGNSTASVHIWYRTIPSVNT